MQNDQKWGLVSLDWVWMAISFVMLVVFLSHKNDQKIGAPK